MFFSKFGVAPTRAVGEQKFYVFAKGADGRDGRPGTHGRDGIPGKDGIHGRDGKDFASLQMLTSIINGTVQKGKYQSK